MKRLGYGLVLVAVAIGVASYLHLRIRYGQALEQRSRLEEVLKNRIPVFPSHHFSAENQTLKTHPGRARRVILMGDSIAQGWPPESLSRDRSIEVINRGIGGQQTENVLAQFYEDGIALRPESIILIAGVNDVTRGVPRATTEVNLELIWTLATKKQIRLILCTLPPAPGHETDIEALNAWLRDFARTHHGDLLDFYSALGGYGTRESQRNYIDGIHPNSAGYQIMSEMTGQTLAAGGSP